jgi:choline transport protein
MITACIVLLYLSYSIPVICLLIRGRSTIKPGPFWLGPIGLFANIVTLCWTLFTLIMYSFPYAKPVASSNMNYVSLVYAVVVIIITTDWFVRGRKSFRGVGERKGDVVVVVEGVRHGSVASVGHA